MTKYIYVTFKILHSGEVWGTSKCKLSTASGRLRVPDPCSQRFYTGSAPLTSATSSALDGNWSYSYINNEIHTTANYIHMKISAYSVWPILCHNFLQQY